VGRSASARRTASYIGCSYKTVERIRTIRKLGTPEIQEAVKNDKLSINGAYSKMCKTKHGKDSSGENPSTQQLRTARITFSEENYAVLKDLGGDVGTHVNVAVEMYVRWMQETKSAEKI